MLSIIKKEQLVEFTFTHQISFPDATGPHDWPVEECKGREATRTGIRVDFLHQYMWYTVMIVEEGTPPPPLTVSPLQHVGAMGDPKWPPPHHRTIQKGGGTEAAQAGFRGAAGYQRTGFPGVWAPIHLGATLQVSWPNCYGLGRWLCCGGEKPSEGAE